MLWIVAGGLLGLTSRLDEATPRVDLGVSTSFVWLAVAFFAGVSAARPRAAAVLGALTLTAANGAYYLRGFQGHTPSWLLLGVLGGAAFALIGHAYRSGAALAAALPLAVGLAELAGVRAHVLGVPLP